MIMEIVLGSTFLQITLAVDEHLTEGQFLLEEQTLNKKSF
jgi:hypothetical protein